MLEEAPDPVVTGPDIDTPRSALSDLSDASTTSALSTSSTSDDAVLVKLFSEIFKEMNKEEQTFYAKKFIEKLQTDATSGLADQLKKQEKCAFDILKKPDTTTACYGVSAKINKQDIRAAYLLMVNEFEFPKKSTSFSLQKLELLSLLIFRNASPKIKDCSFTVDKVSFDDVKFKCTMTSEDKKTKEITFAELHRILVENGICTMLLSTQLKLGKVTKPIYNVTQDVEYNKNRFVFKCDRGGYILMTIIKVDGKMYTTKFELYIDGIKYEWTSISEDMRIYHECDDTKLGPDISAFSTKGGRRRRSKLTKNARKAMKTKKTRKTRRRTAKKNKSRRN